MVHRNLPPGHSLWIRSYQRLRPLKTRVTLLFIITALVSVQTLARKDSYFINARIGTYIAKNVAYIKHIGQNGFNRQTFEDQIDEIVNDEIYLKYAEKVAEIIYTTASQNTNDTIKRPDGVPTILQFLNQTGCLPFPITLTIGQPGTPTIQITQQNATYNPGNIPTRQLRYAIEPDLNFYAAHPNLSSPSPQLSVYPSKNYPISYAPLTALPDHTIRTQWPIIWYYGSFIHNKKASGAQWGYTNDMVKIGYADSETLTKAVVAQYYGSVDMVQSITRNYTLDMSETGTLIYQDAQVTYFDSTSGTNIVEEIPLPASELYFNKHFAQTVQKPTLYELLELIPEPSHFLIPTIDNCLQQHVYGPASQALGHPYTTFQPTQGEDGLTIFSPEFGYLPPTELYKTEFVQQNSTDDIPYSQSSARDFSQPLHNPAFSNVGTNRIHFPIHPDPKKNTNYAQNKFGAPLPQSPNPTPPQTPTYDIPDLIHDPVNPQPDPPPQSPPGNEEPPDPGFNIMPSDIEPTLDLFRIIKEAFADPFHGLTFTEIPQSCPSPSFRVMAEDYDFSIICETIEQNRSYIIALTAALWFLYGATIVYRA